MAEELKACRADLHNGTPPKVRGLVDKFERAIRAQMRCKADAKSEAKHAVNIARLDLLKAISILGGKNAR